MDIRGFFIENIFFFTGIVAFILLYLFHIYYPSCKNILVKEQEDNVGAYYYLEVSNYPEIKEGYQEFTCFLCEDDCYYVSVKTDLGMEYNIGDKIAVFGELVSNNRDNYYSKGISSVLYFPYIVKKEEGEGILHSISIVRNKILNTIYLHFHGAKASLLSGLLLGADVAYSSLVRKELAVTGTAHIIAVSGFNINLVADIILIPVRFIGRKRLTILAGVILFVFLFLVGIDNIPCSRAFIMYIYICLSKLSGRRAGVFQAWGIALSVLLLIRPFSVLNIGLQLSFLASFCLIILEMILKRIGKKKINGITRSILIALSCSLGTFPITRGFGFTFSEKSLLANVLSSPMIVYVMVSGILVLFFPHPLLAKICDILLELMLMVISLSANISILK